MYRIHKMDSTVGITRFYIFQNRVLRVQPGFGLSFKNARLYPIMDPVIPYPVTGAIPWKCEKVQTFSVEHFERRSHLREKW